MPEMSVTYGLGGFDDCPGGANCVHADDEAWLAAAPEGVEECLGGNKAEEHEVEGE